MIHAGSDPTIQAIDRSAADPIKGHEMKNKSNELPISISNHKIMSKMMVGRPVQAVNLDRYKFLSLILKMKNKVAVVRKVTIATTTSAKSDNFIINPLSLI